MKANVKAIPPKAQALDVLTTITETALAFRFIQIARPT